MHTDCCRKADDATVSRAAKPVPGLFKRVNYFHGMLLDEEDFFAEQRYFREKLKLHNRLIGKGVVQGLEVRHPGRGECGKDKEWEGCGKGGAENGDGKGEEPVVLLKAGWALDCQGNEVIVCADRCVNLRDKLKEMQREAQMDRGDLCDPPEEGAAFRICLGIRYAECKSEPETQYTVGCGQETHPEFSRVREGHAVVLSSKADMCRGEGECLGCAETHGGCCPGADGCACDCTLWLACMEVKGCRVCRIVPIESKLSRQPSSPWESARRRVLKSWEKDPCREEGPESGEADGAAEDAKSIDLEKVVRKSVNDAVKYLAKQDLRDFRKQPLGKVSREVMESIRVQPAKASTRDKILLITDPEEKEVLFAVAEAAQPARPEEK